MSLLISKARLGAGLLARNLPCASELPAAAVAWNPSCGNDLIHTSASVNHIIKLTRLRVVDNSELGKQAMLEGKPPYVIHVYNKRGVGHIGDRVLVAIKGQKKKAVIVGCKGQWIKSHVPRFDTNNCVLVNEDFSPLGKRILVPIPHSLRSRGEYAKLIAIGTRFV